MGALADAALAAGGRVTGVIPASLRDRELAHNGLSELYVVDTMAARKDLMFSRSTAFLALPGGFGTLDELTEALTLIQTRKAPKMPIILVGSSFWKGLLDWLRTELEGAQLINPGDVELMQVIDDPDAIVETIFKFYEAKGFTPSASDREGLQYL
jgi:uncharacterized protein (TIGR00730 family)